MEDNLPKLLWRSFVPHLGVGILHPHLQHVAFVVAGPSLLAAVVVAVVAVVVEPKLARLSLKNYENNVSEKGFENKAQQMSEMQKSDKYLNNHQTNIGTAEKLLLSRKRTDFMKV